MIEAHQLKKCYHIDNRCIPVLEDVSLNVAQGEFAVIQGSSGSGKSTLLSILSGLDHAAAGQPRRENLGGGAHPGDERERTASTAGCG